MVQPLVIQIGHRRELSSTTARDIADLCTRAYDEPFAETLALFPDATHVLGYVGSQLVTHALWVERPLGHRGRWLRSAYVEAVATEPAQQGRGHATAILRALADAIVAFDIGALSPSDPAFYRRLGWESWLGSLAVEQAGRVEPTPDEEVMILRLPHTPPLDRHDALVARWREGDIW